MLENDKAYFNAGQALPSVWPSFLPTLPEGTFLDDIWVAPLEMDQTSDHLTTRGSLLINGNLELGIPGVDAVKLMISAVGGSTYLPLEVQVLPEFAFRMNDMPLALRFSRELLKPVRRAQSSGSDAPVAWEVDPTKEYVDIQFAEVDLEINADGDILVGIEGQIDLPPVMLGDSGVVIEAHDIGLFLDSNSPPPGQPIGWKGIHIGEAALYLPGELGEIVGDLQITDAYIGNGGFTGSVSTTWTPALSAELFGMTFTLDSVEISFVQNALVASSIAGTILLPFFEEPVPVEIAINLNGTFTVRIGGPGAGLYELTKPGLLTLELQSLGFELKENLFTAMMSGKIQPLIGGLDWPGFEVTELSIDSKGHVHVDGGWFDLRDQYSLSFYGFTLEITQLGLGNNDDGTRWVGFSGGLKLIDGFKAGASVEGLRITWGDSGSPSLSFDGVGVEFEVPEVLRFKGEVSYRKITDGAETVHRFDGSLKLEILCINLVIDAEIVFGHASGPDGDYAFMGIYLGIELPAGIPLWATGLALYGMAGLFTYNMAPGRLPDEPWYGIGPGEGWYKRPEIGVTDLSEKWTNEKGALALGAGITIGTLPDNGYTFNGRMLFLISFPGPVLMIEGKANILKERSSLGDDPIFRALVVLDFRAGDFLVGIDVKYKYDDAGRLIEIGAGAEMYFSFSDPSAWHLYLGQKEPRERRIRAHILSLFEANSYYMLDNNSLAFGSWVGYDADWRFGPVSVTLEAWLENNVKVSWRPVHFHGDLGAHGKLEIKVFGFGFGFTIDAYLEGDVFDPFHILAQLTVELNLPWPLPDFEVELTLEWGPEADWPLPPLPLKEIAVEHLKVSTSWPLPREEGLLAPVYANEDGLRIDWSGTPPAFDDTAPPPDNAPVVPLDCRPHVTFSRNVHDKARIGTMVSLVDPETERIGDPEANEGPVEVKYSLTEVRLDAWRNGAWETVARKADDVLPPNASGVEDLFGSWAPTPPLPDGGGQNQGQTKLWLWSKNPFDYVSHGGREWQDWISEHFDNMPCIEIPEQTEHCWTFDSVPLGPLPTLPLPPNFRAWKHPDDGPWLAWIEPDHPLIREISITTTLMERGFCLPSGTSKQTVLGNMNILGILLSEDPNRGVRIHCRDQEAVFGAALDASNNWHVSAGGLPSNPQIEFLADDIRLVLLLWRSRMCLWRICRIEGASEEQINEASEIALHNVNEIERWKNISPVLEPHTNYRLMVRTEIDPKGFKPLEDNQPHVEQVEYSFFRTESGPGLVDLSIPFGVADIDEVSLKDGDGNFIHLDGSSAPADDRTLASQLNDLSLYVRQTLPVTVPGQGEDRPLPRPVYRSYDLGVAFNEDYVSQMYRMDGRDLSLYVYDSNNRPVRDAEGRLIVIESAWDVASDLILDEKEKTWVTTIQKSTCGNIDETEIPHDQTLNVEGLVLEPDFVHEARLTPLLLHEFFGDERFYSVGDSAGGGSNLGRWTIEDAGTVSGPSNWEIAEVGAPAMRVVRQTSNIHSLPIDGTFPEKAGTVLLLADRPDLPGSHPDQPGQWTDYRYIVQMRSGDNDAIGVVFRYSTPNRWYRFSMDRERGYRRLVRAVDGAITILAEDDFTYRTDQDYKITIEAIGSDLAVYQDGERIFRVNDASMDHGRIGLYCWASQNAEFANIRVDDFRETARSVYRFNFTTSNFAHFAHQLHSYEDEVWEEALPAAAFGLVDADAVSPGTNLTDDEARAFGVFADHADVRPLFSQPEDRTTVTRLMHGDEVRGFLVRCPEPVDWRRASFSLTHAPERIPLPGLPDLIKLTGITRDEADANAESVALILRDKLNPNGYAIEQRRLPGPMIAPPAQKFLLEDDFIGDGGLLFEESFGENTLDLYEIVDLGEGASTWAVSTGEIVQTSNIFGGSFSQSSLPKPGTMAITGSPDWSDVRVRVSVTSGDNDSVGFIFRYRDENNFYRFEMNREFGYRRLVKKVDGDFTLLWEDGATYQQNRAYVMEVRAFRRKLYGFVDGFHVFSVQDDSLKRGRVGLYCWANMDTRFDAFTVEAVELDPLFWQPDLTTISAFTAITAPGVIQGPANWQTEPGGIVQISNVHEPTDLTRQAGTFLMGGKLFDDHKICVRLRSDDDDALGVMFRVVDNQNYYRFSIDRQRNRRRLIKMIDGLPVILWQNNVGYNIGQTYELVIHAVGPDIEVILDGVTLLNVTDGDLRTGRVALWCWANQGSHFSDLVVFDSARRIQQWQIIDQGTNSNPSDWRIGNGRLKQRSNIWGGSTVAASANKPGTLAVAGHADWKNYRFKALLRADDDDAVGIVVRYRDAGNYYLFAVDEQRNYRRLIRVEDGIMTTLWTAPGGYTPGDNVTLTLDAIGDRISGYMGDQVLFSVTDGTHTQGKVGLYCWASDRTDFERAEVSVPPQDAHALFLDNFSGPGLGSWAVLDKGTISAPSVWTVVNGELVQSSNIHSLPISSTQPEKEGTYVHAGDTDWQDIILQVDLTADDNDAIGVMFRYLNDNNYYRFSMDRERSYRRLVSKEAGIFRVLWEDDQQFEIGRTYRLTIIAEGGRLSGWFDGVLVFDVRDFQHARGAVGLYCWAVQGARFRRLRVFPVGLRYQDYLMEDDFPVLRTFRWSFIDEGDQNEPSNWDVVAGKLTQSSGISDSNGTRAFGTLAVAHEHDWDDYRMTAVMRATEAGSLGVVFRYQDEDHYYRFSLTSGGQRRLVRRTGNQVDTLWSSPGGLQLNQDYAITVDCLGTRFDVYLNGERLASVLDEEGYTHGTVALYCSDMEGAEFESVTVAGPQWEAYYQFRQEQTIAAGTRMRIRSGSEAEPFTSDPLEENRFVTESFAQGDIRFTDASAQLRVVGPEGEAEHEILFLPESGFGNVNSRVLRKADGTAFVIVRQGGGAFDNGTHRARFEYRRDNSAADSDAPVFSERGVTDDEIANIVIPDH